MLYNTLTVLEPIPKGWSGDRKFRAQTPDGKTVLLRIYPKDAESRVHKEFSLTQQASLLEIPISTPIEFGVCSDGPYMIQTWIDGEDAEEVLPSYPENSVYRYGLDAGIILKKLHTIPAPADQPDWEERFNRKIDRKIAAYQNCPLKYENGERFLRYLEQNRHLLHGRPQTFQHGDYHIGNMMLSGGTLFVIDFNRFDFGDPWEEFNRIVWCAQKCPVMACGMVDGYFEGNPPIEFWQLLALYISSNTLSSLPWAIPFGEPEIITMTKQAQEVLEWYDFMEQPVPSWYRNFSRPIR